MQKIKSNSINDIKVKKIKATGMKTKIEEIITTTKRFCGPANSAVHRTSRYVATVPIK